ncbi:hypothetical protein niasHT_012789 [Heterodera trifolii]|uniref:Uncharacterized protein n=1 Tax=Heterodera trifolii TaxID=157864 RepID=A0ABD2I6B0_9BILA
MSSAFFNCSILLLFTTMAFISTAKSLPLVTYNFNQPIQLLRLLKMDPRRQMALIRLSDSAFKRRYVPAERQTYSAQQPFERTSANGDETISTEKKWDTKAMYWPKMLLDEEWKR